MVSLKGSEIVDVEIADAISKQKLVKSDNQTVLAARAVGIAFGDE
jgi:hypothetical protein